MTNELLPSTAQVVPADQRGLKPARRTAAIFGVLAVVVVAVAAIVAWAAARNDSDTGEALFVLPVPIGDWQLSEGAVTDPDPDPDAVATGERFITDGSLYGSPDGEGFDELRSIAHHAESPLPGARWEPATTPRGDGYQRVDDSMTFAIEQEEYGGAWAGSGGGWLVASSPTHSVYAYDMLSNDTDRLVLVAFFPELETPEIPVMSFVMASPGGSTFAVDTAAGSPLFDAATFAERVEAVDINGTAGWVVTDEGEEATATVVTWSPETGRTVSVRSSAPPDEVVDAARQLRQVPAEEWTSAFPDLGGE